MIPTEDILLQAISSYYPDVWPFRVEDDKGDTETTKREKDASINAEFLRWVHEIKSQERMNDAFLRLREIADSRGNKEFKELVAHVLVTCFGVTPYADNLRSNQLSLRDDYRECIENLRQQYTSLKSFKQAYRRNKGYGFMGDSIPVSSGFSGALKRAGLQLEGQDPRKYLMPLDFLETLTDEYLDRLELDDVLDRQGELSFMKNKIDALIYPDEVPKQARRDDSSVNSLLFHLSFLFRQYTSPYSDSPWLKKIKGEMSADGQPCYGHVTDIANAIDSSSGFNSDEEEELSDQQVRQRVNNLTSNGVCLGSLFTVDF
jgi:hypothetical protein